MMNNDDAFDAMADLQRRQLLNRLFTEDPQPVPLLSSVSQEILQAQEGFLREYLTGSREIANADKADIRTHHVHLPKLTEYGHVKWDRDAHVTTKGPKFDDVKPLLELVENQRDERLAKDAPMTLQK